MDNNCIICNDTGHLFVNDVSITCICQTTQFNFTSVTICENGCKTVKDCDQSCKDQK